MHEGKQVSAYDLRGGEYTDHSQAYMMLFIDFFLETTNENIRFV